MNTIGNYRIKLAIISLLSLTIYLIFRSIRIEQFKKVDPSTIKAIGEYEEKSKFEYEVKIDSIFNN